MASSSHAATIEDLMDGSAQPVAYRALNIAGYTTQIADIQTINIPEESRGCYICYELYDENDHRAIQTCCGHTFGESCVAQWISAIQRGSATCPLCRACIAEREHTGTANYIQEDDSTDSMFTSIEQVIDHYSELFNSDIEFTFPGSIGMEHDRRMLRRLLGNEDPDPIGFSMANILSYMRGFRGTPRTIITRMARRLESMEPRALDRIGDSIESIMTDHWWLHEHTQQTFRSAVANSVAVTVLQDLGHDERASIRVGRPYVIGSILPISSTIRARFNFLCRAQLGPLSQAIGHTLTGPIEGNPREVARSVGRILTSRAWIDTPMTMSDAEKTIEALTKLYFDLVHGDLRGTLQQGVEWPAGMVEDPQVQMVRFRGRVMEEIRNRRRTIK